MKTNRSSKKTQSGLPGFVKLILGTTLSAGLSPLYWIENARSCTETPPPHTSTRQFADGMRLEQCQYALWN
jgi:hypothetical protein